MSSGKSKHKKKRLTIPIVIKILKTTFNGFNDDDVLKLSGSLAYATLFSLIPFLSLLITLGTFVHVDLADHIFDQLKVIIGEDVIGSLQGIIENARSADSSTLATVITLGITIFGATAIFAEIQGSLNTIWGIKAVPKKGWLKYIKNRLLSFSLILIFGFILMMTFTLTNVVGIITDHFMYDYPAFAHTMVKIAGMVLNIVFTVTVFTLMFKVLPDAKIRVKDVVVGALVTTILFMVGQWGISLYIRMSDIGGVYGAAAFIIILITWIYYSAIIIYIGAEFTQAWADERGHSIFPDQFAVATKTVEIINGKPVVPKT